MENNLLAAISRVCAVLQKHSVEYMLVGGTAVALHGYFRYSTLPSGAIAEKPDLDFWYNPSYTNYFNLLDALEALGQDISRFRNEQQPNPKKSFFRYEFEDFTLDLLPELKSSIRFTAAFVNRETVDLAGIKVAFIGYNDLLTDKVENARPKDLTDIEELENRRETGIG
ncbi:hypothetical protein [Hymenobacter metallilatus]|uniref:Nucleotidyl transferase AbiEii/AbiGii toxin family protein n=1 Tax=Hymenobacter metallilatus TaxID=2493666 RepID=A0A3R9LXH2_9BACT|nr:hypothetical protein [Hymenobacter metallilatus]RSK24094.1 hypothetical protein EI290_21095 [Hymenobacter metallilatus]